jgi:diacylglycerol kinase family enzyme
VAKTHRGRVTFLEASPPPELTADRSDQRRFRVAALINAGSGTLAKLDATSFQSQLAAGFAKHGIDAAIRVVDGAALQKATEEALAAAQEQRIDAVVVGGGDGTIRTVAGVLADSGIPLGVLPLGTLNHFAKDAGIPTDMDGALEVIAAKCVHRIDLGEVNGQIFVNNSSIGVYPSLVLRRDQTRRSEGHSKWVATLIAALRLARQFPVHRLYIYVNGAKEPVRTPCLFIGNNHYDLTASSFGQRKSLEEGSLCLYAAKRQSRIGLLWLTVRAALGFLDRAQDLRTFGAARAEIRSRKSRLFVAMDGEVELMRPPLIYRSRSGALNVLGPPPTKS